MREDEETMSKIATQKNIEFSCKNKLRFGCDFQVCRAWCINPN